MRENAYCIFGTAKNAQQTFVQCWTSVEDVGPTLYNCYTNVLFAGLGDLNGILGDFYYLSIDDSELLGEKIKTFVIRGGLWVFLTVKWLDYDCIGHNR